MNTEKHIQTGESGKGYNLIGLCHGTVAEEAFSEFDCRGLGVHIGTYEQAKAALEDLHGTTGRIIQINARVLNPIRLPDMGSFWSSPIRMIGDKRQYPFDDLSALKHECATRLVLQQNGFDGIVYANQFEGVLKRDDDSLSASPINQPTDDFHIGNFQCQL